MKYLSALFLILLSCALFAQPGTNDPTFNPGDPGFGYGDGASGAVNVTAIQSDGKILIGGVFTLYNGTTASHIARLNTDGSLDNTFVTGTGFNNDIWAIAVQSDGKIIVGGYFTTYNGTNINRIIRLNSDGSYDNTFNVGTGTNSYVLSASIQSDGKIVIVGNFTTYNGVSANYITRINTDGSKDATFTPGTGANAMIQSLAIQSDGKIMIGGAFTSFNGTARNYVARLNAAGTIDAGFNPGTGANSNIITIAVQSDGKILIGGSFTTYNGSAKNRIVRLNSGGTLDATFVIGTGSNNTVSCIKIQTDGKILFAGDFISYNGTSRNRIASLNTDGSIDNTFTVTSGANTYVSSVSIQTNGKIIIGGFFASYDGIPKNRVARINTDGSIDNTFLIGTGSNSAICKMVIQSDGKIIIGGDFTSYNGVNINRIARLNTDGSIDNTFDPGTGANFIVYAIALQSDGKIMIGGDFTFINGTSRNYIARLNSDGSLDNTFNPGTGAGSSVYSILIQSDGKIIAGGNFTSYNGTARNRITRINADGSIDNTFNVGTGTGASINTMAMQSDGKVIIGGNFTTYNGTTINRIARLNTNGSLDNTFNVGTGAGAYILSIAIQTDGKVIIGGSFITYNGTTIYRIARLNSDGSLDNTFITGMGFNNDVRTIGIQSDGRIFCGGNFTTYNGVAKVGVTRLNSDGSLNTSFNTASGTNNIVRTSAIQSDTKILIGGDFISYSGVGRNRLARIYNCADTYNTISVTECDSYTAPDGTVHTTSGIKTAIIPNAALCDSVITIDLTIKNSTSNSITVSACNTYTAPDGAVYTASGVKTAIIPNAVGCDSVITINLTINTNTTSSISVTACDSYTAPDGAVYTTSGIKTAVINNAAGCDSTITIDLTVNTSTTSSISVTDCDSYTAPDGQVHTTSGIKTAVITNAAGCDSTITINLTIELSTTNSISVSQCDTYTAPDGQVYTTSGIKTAIIPNSIGCDSVITIDLTILNSTASSISVTACDTYTAPDGQIYTTPGVKTAIISNAADCDSTITIDLTINTSSASSISVTECDSYTAPDGIVYTTSGTKTAVIPNSFGCDSTITIDLTINYSTTNSFSVSQCDSYTAPDGQVYSASGTITAIVPNSIGCDSVITIDLTILNSTSSAISVNACDSYTAPDGQIYYIPGTYTALIENTAGCDSTITITLTLQQPYQNEEICMVTVDTVLWKNKVIWENTPGVGTVSHNIYRELSGNVYQLIGTVPYDSLSVFVDISSMPNLYDSKYKISVVDTCGDESVRSYYHKTMFLHINGIGSTMMLYWSEYNDESGMFMPAYYYIYRGTQPDNMTLIDSVSSLYANYPDSNIYDLHYYMVGTLMIPSCNSGNSDTSYSNYVGNNMLVGISYSEINTGIITISPNPMSTTATLEIPAPKSEILIPKFESSSDFDIRISDLTGKVVRIIPHTCHPEGSEGSISVPIERGDLKPGIYYVELQTEKVYRAKLIVE